MVLSPGSWGSSPLSAGKKASLSSSSPKRLRGWLAISALRVASRLARVAWASTSLPVLLLFWLPAAAARVASRLWRVAMASSGTGTAVSVGSGVASGTAVSVGTGVADGIVVGVASSSVSNTDVPSSLIVVTAVGVAVSSAINELNTTYPPKAVPPRHKMAMIPNSANTHTGVFVLPVWTASSLKAGSSKEAPAFPGVGRGGRVGAGSGTAVVALVAAVGSGGAGSDGVEAAGGGGVLGGGGVAAVKSGCFIFWVMAVSSLVMSEAVEKRWSGSLAIALLITRSQGARSGRLSTRWGTGFITWAIIMRAGVSASKGISPVSIW